MSPDICPNCGADVPAGAAACPECGADERTGWSEKARYDNLGIPDDPEDSFNYDEYVRREFEGYTPADQRRRFWQKIGILLLVVLLLPLIYLAISSFFAPVAR